MQSNTVLTHWSDHLCEQSVILWYSKCQNTVETSTFGSEYCAMKIAIDMIEGLRYKLRMMGIPLSGPTSVFCDNQSVVKNMTAPGFEEAT